MKLYKLHQKQVLPTTLADAWDFFSRPQNLEKITPPFLRFEIRNGAPPKMYAGMIVEYRIRDASGIPMTWVTEITRVDEPYLFIDEQRFGPYKFWHHQHYFREVEGGIEAEDIVHYAMPFGPIGQLVHAVYVKRQLQQIFDFRKRFLEEKYGKMEKGF